MGGVGGAVVLLGGGALYKIGVPLPFIVGAGVMLIAIGIVVALVKEPDLSDQPAAEQEPGPWANVKHVATDRDRSGLFLLPVIVAWFVGWNATEAFFTLYAGNVLGVEVGSGAQMLTAFAATLIDFVIPSGLMATRIGRKPTIMIGLAGMMIGARAGLPGTRPDRPDRRARRHGRVLGAGQHQLAADGVRPGRAGASAPTLDSTTSCRRWRQSPAPSWLAADRLDKLSDHLAILADLPGAGHGADDAGATATQCVDRTFTPEEIRPPSGAALSSHDQRQPRWPAIPVAEVDVTRLPGGQRNRDFIRRGREAPASGLRLTHRIAARLQPHEAIPAIGVGTHAHGGSLFAEHDLHASNAGFVRILHAAPIAPCKLSETKPDAIHLSTCMAKAKPDCPYATAEQFAEILRGKTGLPVVLGTHDYH